MPLYSIRQTRIFQDWLDHLSDRQAQVRIAARIRMAGFGNLGDWQPVGGSVSEMRIDSGPGYRLYFTRRGKTGIVLLVGGDKSSQRRDIELARQIARNLEQGT